MSRNFSHLTLINTNARSLSHKIDSLHETMEEFDASVAVVTETWFGNGPLMDEASQDLGLGAGTGLLYCNRDPCASNGELWGVAILWKESFGFFRKIDIKNPDGFEILAAAGTVNGHSRKLIVLACYLLPNMPRRRADDCLVFLSNLVNDLKGRFKNPYICVTGDFNQWEVELCLADYNDIKEVHARIQVDRQNIR